MKRLIDFIIILSYYQRNSVLLCAGQVAAGLFRCCTHTSSEPLDSISSSKEFSEISFTESLSTPLSGAENKNNLGFKKFAKQLTNVISPRRSGPQSASKEYLVNSPDLQDDQFKQVQQWKLEPGISYLIDQLELRVTSIVHHINKFEVNELNSEQLAGLMKTFQVDGVVPMEKVKKLAQCFIEDAYRSWYSSVDAASKANSYLKYEYTILKEWTSCPTWESDADALMEYIKLVESKAIKHYRDYEDLLDEWKYHMSEIQKQFKHVLKKNQSPLLKQQMLQIKVRSGDELLYNYIQQSALEDKSLEEVQGFFLREIKGVRSLNYKNLFICTKNIHDDLKQAIESFETAQKADRTLG